MTEKLTEMNRKQLERIESRLNDMGKSIASNRVEILWLKKCMSAFFATIMALVYKIFGT